MSHEHPPLSVSEGLRDRLRAEVGTHLNESHHCTCPTCHDELIQFAERVASLAVQDERLALEADFDARCRTETATVVPGLAFASGLIRNRREKPVPPPESPEEQP